jgi:hypothetical protein
MIIKGGLVRIHDDYMRNTEESLEILKRVEDNAYTHLVEKYARRKEQENPNQDGVSL